MPARGGDISVFLYGIHDECLGAVKINLTAIVKISFDELIFSKKRYFLFSDASFSHSHLKKKNVAFYIFLFKNITRSNGSGVAEARNFIPTYL